MISVIWLQNNCVKISIFLPNFITREGFITKVNDEYIIVRGALNKDFYDMDIIFISYDEPSAESRYNLLKEKFILVGSNWKKKYP